MSLLVSSLHTGRLCHFSYQGHYWKKGKIQPENSRQRILQLKNPHFSSPGLNLSGLFYTGEWCPFTGLPHWAEGSLTSGHSSTASWVRFHGAAIGKSRKRDAGVHAVAVGFTLSVRGETRTRDRGHTHINTHTSILSSSSPALWWITQNNSDHIWKHSVVTRAVKYHYATKGTLSKH